MSELADKLKAARLAERQALAECRRHEAASIRAVNARLAEERERNAPVPDPPTRWELDLEERIAFIKAAGLPVRLDPKPQINPDVGDVLQHLQRELDVIRKIRLLRAQVPEATPAEGGPA